MNLQALKSCYFTFSASLVTQLGLEPKTYRLEICCSIQLSYWAIFYGCKGSKKDRKRKQSSGNLAFRSI